MPPNFRRFPKTNVNVLSVLLRYKALGATLALGATAFYFTHREPAPVTGRVRFIALSKAFEEYSTRGAKNAMLQQFGPKLLSKTNQITIEVCKVVNNLVESNNLKETQWNIHVIDSDVLNAFVLPGGSVFVTTGLLRICKNSDALAFVLGHEMAHEYARHYAERISIHSVLLLAQMAATLLLDIPMNLTTMLSTLMIKLPFSRTMEREADYIGLLFAAKACYDPKEAISYWERMSDEMKIPIHHHEFLSTHPCDSSRIENLQKHMPEANMARELADCTGINKQFEFFIKSKNPIRRLVFM